jgi:hypothetical protein
MADNFFLDAFRWDKGLNELHSHIAHWHRHEIPRTIFIHGKYFKVEYAYVGIIIGAGWATFHPVSATHYYDADLYYDADKPIPKAYLKYY